MRTWGVAFFPFLDLRRARYGIIGLAVFFTVFGHESRGWFPPVTTIELGLRDILQQVLASDEGSDQIALIDIHEKSLQDLGPWPWPRQTLADLTEVLIKEHQVRLVVLDVVLPVARDPPGDAALARLAQGRQLVLSEVFDYAERSSPIVTGVPSSGLPSQEGISHTAKVQASGHLSNHAGLADAPCVGNIGFVPDSDGKLRQLPLVTEWDGRLHLSLAAAAVHCLGNDPLSGVSIRSLEKTGGLYRLRFRNQDSNWLVVPANALIRSDKAADPSLSGLLRDRIVIIGSSALGLSDRVATPLSASISGMFVHAQMLSELLRAQEKRLPAPLSPPLSLAAQLALVGLLALALLRSTSLIWLFTSASMILMAWLVLAGWQASTGAVDPVMPAVWGFAVLTLGLIPWEWFENRRQARSTRRLLSRYVAPDVLKKILRSSRANQASLLAPQSTVITVLVADMAGYSEATKSLSLEQAATLTRSFLSAITGPVWQNRGTLDRYTGDGLVAFWGAPAPDPNQSQHALKAAREMLEEVEKLGSLLTAQGLPTVSVRIGLAQGPALVGDFGTSYRAAYTAVGNCINLASRLEALAKEKGLALLMTEELAQPQPISMAASSEGPAAYFLGKEFIRGFGPIALYSLERLKA